MIIMIAIELYAAVGSAAIIRFSAKIKSKY